MLNFHRPMPGPETKSPTKHRFIRFSTDCPFVRTQQTNPKEKPLSGVAVAHRRQYKRGEGESGETKEGGAHLSTGCMLRCLSLSNAVGRTSSSPSSRNRRWRSMLTSSERRAYCQKGSNPDPPARRAPQGICTKLLSHKARVLYLQREEIRTEY